MDLRALKRLIAPVARRVRLAIARGVVSLINDATKMQELQVQLLDDEIAGRVERFQNYGFTSHPKPGAECVVLSVSGNRNHSVAICVDDRRYRFKPIAEGEVAIFTDEGDHIHFKRDRIIEILAGAKIVATAPEVEVTATTVEVVATTSISMSAPTVNINGDNINLTATAEIKLAAPAIKEQLP